MTETIRTLALRASNAYLVKGDTGYVLIDTGFRFDRSRLEAELRAAGCGPGDLRLIVITHGDPDHSGNAAFLREAYGAKIAMHRAEAPAVERGDMFLSRGSLSFPRRLMKPAVRLFRLRKRDRFTPDTFLEDGDRLDEHGLDATVLHVPGHSAGSIAVLTADGVLFSGDFLENRTRPSLATLVDDAEAMKASFERAKRLDVRIVYPGHGEPFTMDEIGNPDAGHRPASRTEAKRSTSKTRSVGEEDGSSLNARKAGTIVKTDTSVARQYESWANSYDRDKVEIIERDLGISLEAFVDRILDRCHLTAGQRVIDVGTGTGLIAISIAKRLSNDCNILGIDLSDAMLGKAKVRVKEEGVEQSVALRKASALDIPVEDATQDLVVCVFTIRHTDIRETLRGFMRVLKPGGRAVVVDLCAPRKWRSIPARVLLPLFRVGLLLAGRKVRAERRSTLLTASEWETLIEETHGRTAEVEEFPNRTEPDWKPGKVIVAWNRDEFGTGR